ncbi:hypothetical protein [Iningainema tapete]|uniref:Uncharacterized protein n=1 Tax=Iningainema tapete BLCC-T55 TaxID=2748662 RepID=A0A8J6XJ35_9CYAN|nr:hypothetical protein [Iningainema tapete]MBD2771187.1 hypothetical protein [Iningainema tapete BLCC-T55]
MSRSTIANRRHLLFDKGLELRDYNATAVATTTSETAIEFAADKQLAYKAVILAGAYTGYAAGSAEWKISIEAATTVAGTYKEIGSCTADGTIKQFDIPLSGEWVEDLLPGALYIRATATAIGAPDALTYGAFLAC